MELSKALAMAENRRLELAREFPDLLNWSWKFHAKKRSWGTCRRATKELFLSSFLTPLAEDAQVMDTINHELAHAVVACPGHGREWQRMARRFGATPRSRSKSVDKDEAGYRWALVFGSEFVKGYYKLPPRIRQRLRSMFLRGRKAETMGKLELVPFEQYKRR